MKTSYLLKLGSIGLLINPCLKYDTIFIIIHEVINNNDGLLSAELKKYLINKRIFL